MLFHWLTTSLQLILRSRGHQRGARGYQVASDSVTRVNDSTRVTIFGVSDSTRVTLRKMVTRLASHFSQNHSSHSQWLESESLLQNLYVPDWTNTVRLHTRKYALFASVMIKIGVKFMFCLSTRAMLHFKDQVSPTCIEEDFAFTEGSAGHNIDISSWFIVVFAYRDHGSGPHTVTLSLFQIAVRWFKFFRFKSKPKTILQSIMQIRKPNLV